MTFGGILTAVFFSSGIGFFAFNWSPLLYEFWMEYYKKEEKACKEILDQAHVELPHLVAPLFYAAGPIFFTLFFFLIIPSLTFKFLFAIPFSWFSRKTGRVISQYVYEYRLKQIKKQLMDTMGLIANALRSGLSLLQSIEMAAIEMPGATAREFEQIVQETKLGSNLEESLIHFKNRIPLKEVATLVDSVLILKETGGNLVETFEIMIHTLKEEERVQGKIRTLTTQGIAQAVVIILLPFGLAGALYSVSPEYILPLIQHPVGWGIITLILLLQFIGGYTMKKIVTIKI